jgi:hypothetical protein
MKDDLDVSLACGKKYATTNGQDNKDDQDVPISTVKVK